jgi:O-6-methylguanine DNA methyltransferase
MSASSSRQTASAFQRRILAAVRRIPPGRVATYGDVARAAGRPKACRAVGHVMATCHDPSVPCHRVVAAGGRLGGFGGQEGLKAALLRAEGVHVSAGRIRRFVAVREPPRATGRISRTGNWYGNP